MKKILIKTISELAQANENLQKRIDLLEKIIAEGEYDNGRDTETK